MKIKDVRIYIKPGTPKQRSVSNRGGMELVPPGRSGRFTHASGFGPPSELPEGWLEACQDSTEYPTFDATLRLVTDGPLHPYTSFGSDFLKRRFEPDFFEIKCDLCEQASRHTQTSKLRK